MSKEFSVGGIAYPVTDLAELVSTIADSTRRDEVKAIAEHLVPKGINYVTEKDNTKDPVRTVLAAALIRKHLLLEGPKGAGKTTAVYKAAQETSNPLVSIQFTGHTGVDTLLGKWLLKDGKTYWQDGLFTLACRYGFWVVLDEINMALPEVTAALHSALDDRRVLILDEKDGEVIDIHPNTRIFAAINPSEDYAGTKEMNAALVDRFGMKLFTNYPNARKETDIIVGHKDVAIDDSPQARSKEGFISRIVKVGNQIRNTEEKQFSGRVSISTRELINWASLCSIYPALEAFELTVSNKTEWSDRKVREFLFKAASIEFNPTDVWKVSGGTVKAPTAGEVVEL